MKSKLLILTLIIGGTLAANSGYAQVRVNVGIGVPAPVIYETDYPGYAYYTYPAWNGHYRDRFYFEHYHAVFEREHRGYFNGRNFDHARFERERHVHPYGGRPGGGRPGGGRPGEGHPGGGRPGAVHGPERGGHGQERGGHGSERGGHDRPGGHDHDHH